MMKKLIFAVAFVLALCLCFAGCGGDDDKTTSSTEGSINGTMIEAALSDILGGLASGGGYDLPEEEF